MLKAHILLLVSLAIINPISVSASTVSTEYQPILLRNSVIVNSDYLTLQRYYSSQSLPLIQEKIAEEKRIAEETARIQREKEQFEREEQGRQEAEKNRLKMVAAEQAKKKAQAEFKPVQVASFGGSDYESLIRERCAQLGCNAEQVIRVMYCESGGRANAVNRGGSGASGLFQFMPPTFNANAKRVGLAGASIWDPNAQIIVATAMFANGQAGQWSCK